MRLVVLPRLCCPACLAAGRESPFEVDAVRVGGGEDGGIPGDLAEGYLVCAACRGAWPIVAGVAILPLDLPRHLAKQGNVYRRTPLADPRVTRYVLGMAGGGFDLVPFDEVLERYGDLLPFDPATPARPLPPFEAALDDLLRARGARGPGLEVGTGVGRGTFLLAGRVGEAIGVDRSVARLRRARNVQTAVEFRLPSQPGARAETPIDLARLVRTGTDFAVADPERLPFFAGTFATVVVRARDGVGGWGDPAAVAREARRVAGPDGLVILEGSGDAAGRASVLSAAVA